VRLAGSEIAQHKFSIVPEGGKTATATLRLRLSK
jgi:hypothetical protein